MKENILRLSDGRSRFLFRPFFSEAVSIAVLDISSLEYAICRTRLLQTFFLLSEVVTPSS